MVSGDSDYSLTDKELIVIKYALSALLFAIVPSMASSEQIQPSYNGKDVEFAEILKKVREAAKTECSSFELQEYRCASLAIISPDLEVELEKRAKERITPGNIDWAYALPEYFDLNVILGSKHQPLIVVDMQEGFLGNFILKSVADDVRLTIQNILSEIREAIKNGVPIVIVTYEGERFGPLIPEIEKEIYGYKNLIRLTKTNDDFMASDGNAGIIMNKIPREKFPEFRITGLNEHVCVLESIKGLIEYGYIVVLNDNQATHASLGIDLYVESLKGYTVFPDARKLVEDFRVSPKVKHLKMKR
jgi:nicotinamidase-related amidase